MSASCEAGTAAGVAGAVPCAVVKVPPVGPASTAGAGAASDGFGDADPEGYSGATDTTITAIGLPGPRNHVARRTAEGKTTREITRCLKRYVAREIHHYLTAASTPEPAAVMGTHSG